MAAIGVLQFALYFLVILFIASQVIVPLIRGTKLFPIFSLRSELEKELIELNEQREIAALRKRVEAERKNLEREKNVAPVVDMVGFLRDKNKEGESK